ncbi:MAG: adenylate kinase [Bacteroidales bacterium]|nr:adenylate kinase [Bacteroidales bacterium]
MLNIALFGPPGAGKGTQSALLMEKYNLSYIATGDILRQEIAKKTALGLEAHKIISEGGLVSDEIIIQIIEERLKTDQSSAGFLFDGFPRTYIQAYILDGLLSKIHTSLTTLISLQVNKKEAMTRLLERAKTSGRSDDNKEVILNRLKEYDEKTLPVLGFYDDLGIHAPIDGEGSIDDVFLRIIEQMDLALSKSQMNIVLFGYPGAGRATQARRLAKEFDLVYLATGDMLTAELHTDSELKRTIEPHIKEGTLVPDELIVRLIEKKIKENPNAKGFIFKGFPRTLVQAYILDGLLRKQGTKISCIINIEVPTLELVKRLDARGKTKSKMPYDGSTQTIVKRLEMHEKKTLPVLDYYKKTIAVYHVNGVGTEDEVYQRAFQPAQETYRNIH